MHGVEVSRKYERQHVMGRVSGDDQVVYIIEEQQNKGEMENDSSLKLSSTSKKQNIFHVRRLPYKQFDNQKYLKENYSPLHAHKNSQNSEAVFPSKHRDTSSASSTISMDYYHNLTLTSAPAYKELQTKYAALKEKHQQEKEQKLKILREKELELEQWIAESKRIALEQQKLMRKREQLCYYIQRLREHRQWTLQYRQQQQLMGIEQMNNMMMGVHYQGGVDIDPDNMTYEELLQLEERIGKVSKGFTQEQYQSIAVMVASQQHEQELCSICYYNVKEGEQIHKLSCQHIFHCDCIKEWLLKERVCPMCKQQVILDKQAESAELLRDV